MKIPGPLRPTSPDREAGTFQFSKTIVIVSGTMIFRAVLTDKGNDQTLFSRFLARATLVPEVFLEIRCRRFAASFLFVAKKNFIKKPLEPRSYARAIFRENLF